MFRTLPAAALLAGAVASTFPAAHARETVLVIGDSLSREYQFEFPTFPEARNWVELLAQERAADFSFGELGTTDLGLLADACDLFNLGNPVCAAIGDGELERYRYNWAIPTLSAADYAELLTGGSLFQSLFQQAVAADLDDVDLTVVFLGGNDIDRTYGPIYNGSSAASTTAADRIVADLTAIVDFILDEAPAMQVVLVNVPHVGATPEVKANHPTHPVRTARVTATLTEIDRRLRSLARRRGIAYADVLTLTTALLDDSPYCIAGVPFLNRGTDSGAADHIWLGGDISQNFHPNTNGQALVANAIIRAYNQRYSAATKPFSDFEIVESILGFHTPFTSWAAAAGLPADLRQRGDDPDRDGLDNRTEFALGLDPNHRDPPPAPRVVDGTAVLEFRLREDPCPTVTVTPQASHDLRTWRDLAHTETTTTPSGHHRVSVPAPAQRAPVFLRLHVADTSPAAQ